VVGKIRIYSFKCEHKLQNSQKSEGLQILGFHVGIIIETVVYTAWFKKTYLFLRIKQIGLIYKRQRSTLLPLLSSLHSLVVEKQGFAVRLDLQRNPIDLQGHCRENKRQFFCKR